MPFPPTLKQSLKHVAVIGRYRWKQNSLESERRISLAPDSNVGVARRAVGFELVYGPRTLVIDGRPFSAFGVAAPCEVESTWSPSEFPGLGSISLSDNDPLITSLDAGAAAAQIGGIVFRKLLDNLDGLRNFWCPDFDYQLTIAAYHWVNVAFKGQPKRPTGRSLKSLLFQPDVNARLIAALRAGVPARDEKQEIILRSGDVLNAWGSLREVLEASIARDFGSPIAGEVASKLVEQLAEMLAEFGLADVELPARLREFIDRGDQAGQIEKDERLPGDLGKQWRTFRGHFESARKTLDCEPLFALVILWYFHKVAGRGNVEKWLYNEIYSKHTENAVLAAKERAEDQDVSNKTLDKKLDETFAFLKIGEQDEPDKLVRAFAKSIMTFVKARIVGERNPRTKFEREDLIDWLKERFGELLPFGMAAGEQIMKELGDRAAQILSIYQRLGGIYSDDLTLETIESASPAEKSEGKEIWDAACAALRKGFKGTAGAAFRGEFNALMAQKLAEHFKNWLQNEIGSSDSAAKKTGLAARLETLAEQYLAQVEFLDKQRGGMPALAGSNVFVGRRDAESRPKDEKKEAPEKKTMAAAAGAPSSSAAPRSTPPLAKAPESPASNPPPGAPVDSTAPGQDWKSEFTRMLMTDSKGAETSSPEFHEQFETLEDTRRRVVQCLSAKKDELAPARATWRAMAAAEIILCGDPSRSSLGDDHTSMGIYLLLELIRHVGAAPKQEDEKYRNRLQEPEQDTECGVKNVPIWDIYQVPRNRDEAMAILAEMVVYWETIATAVMNCKGYAADVAEMKSFLERALTNGNRVTFYNETLAEHVSRQVKADYCYSAKVEIDPKASLEPPSYVWVSDQALPRGSQPGFQPVQAVFDRDVNEAFQSSLWAARAHSYPLLIAERTVGGPHGQASFSTRQFPVWSSRTLLEHMLGIFADDRNRYMIGGSEHQVRTYTQQHCAEFLAPIEMQTCILTAALFQQSHSSAKKGLNSAITEARQPGKAGQTEEDARRAEESVLCVLKDGAYVPYASIQPPADGTKIGWNRAPVSPDLIAGARSGAGIPI